jgi:hypothetical protein
MPHRKPLSLLALLAFALVAGAEASIADRYGLTSESAALGGARAGAGEFSSASSVENPSQLSLDPAGPGRVRFHWGVLYSAPRFADIRGVVVANAVNSDTSAGAEDVRDVDTTYPVTFGQSVGFSIQSARSERRWGFGAVAYLPLDRLALVDSGQPYEPEYVLHRSTQRPDFRFAFSGLLSSELAFGAGLAIGTKLDSSTTVFLNQGAGTSSWMRISASLKTKATPYLGLSWKASDSLRLGLNWRFASSQPETLNVRATARAIGNVSALDFSYPAISTMYYDPATLEVGGKWDYAGGRALYFQADWQRWSSFESPALVIQDPWTSSCTGGGCGGVDFSPGRDLSRPTRDLVVPRIGHSWSIGDGELRAGYLYRPGIYRDLPIGAGNTLDPDEHRWSAGYGAAFDSFFAFDAPGRLDFHASWSLYPKARVEKSPGDENGATPGRKVGDPGYDVGGHEWGGGLTLQLFL